MLVWPVRREGIRLIDLVGLGQGKLLNEALLGVIWSFTEELTYQGYTLPRLQVVAGRRTWAA